MLLINEFLKTIIKRIRTDDDSVLHTFYQLHNCFLGTFPDIHEHPYYPTSVEIPVWFQQLEYAFSDNAIAHYIRCSRRAN